MEPGRGGGCDLEMRHELNEFALQRGGIRALVRCDEVGNSRLSLQRAQRLGDGLVVDGCEVERGVELACLHIVDEGLPVGCSGVADTVFPDGIEMIRYGVGKAAEIAVQVAIAVRLKDRYFDLRCSSQAGMPT